MPDKDSIRVFVSAGSIGELTELKSVVRQSDFLDLVGTSRNREHLDELLESTQPDVLLEQSSHSPEDDDPDDFSAPEISGATCVRVLLVPESHLPAALRGVRSSRTPVRGILPPWRADYEIRAAIAAAADGLIVLHPDFAERGLAASAPPLREAGPVGEALSPREHEILQLLAAGSGQQASRRAAQNFRAHREIPCELDLQQTERIEPRGSGGHRCEARAYSSVAPTVLFFRRCAKIPVEILPSTDVRFTRLR